jgi:hypothetical protein
MTATQNDQDKIRAAMENGTAFQPAWMTNEANAKATQTRKTTRARKPAAPKFADLVARKTASGMDADTAAQQAQVEVWAARHNVSYNHRGPINQVKAIDADHADALKTNARQAKIDAMNAVEDFEIEGGRLERAFEDLCTHYSEGNAMLILAQAEALGIKVRGLRDVGGFQTWQERGRAIIKGQHQMLYIWGKKVERDENEFADKPPLTVVGENNRKARSFYPIVGLFHISQTEDLEKAKARWAAEKAAK